MINRNAKWAVMGLCVLSCAALSILATGCSGDDDQPTVVAQPAAVAPAPPPPPAVTPIEQLMAELNIDQRVTLPEDKAPDNTVDRKAVLVFFDAMARGNSQSLKGMLPLTDQLELNDMVDSGVWQETVAKIKKVEIQTGMNALNQKCALAVIEIGAGAVSSFQPQLWYFTSEGEAPVFEAAPTPPGILDKLSGNWITAWHQILADELAIAEQPDEAQMLAQRNLDTGEDNRSDSAPPPPPGGLRIKDPNGRPKTPVPGP